MTHVGLFNYPTKVGLPNKILKGRNIVPEINEILIRFRPQEKVVRVVQLPGD